MNECYWNDLQNKQENKQPKQNISFYILKLLMWVWFGSYKLTSLKNKMACFPVTHISRKPKCQNISQELNLSMFLFDEIHRAAWTKTNQSDRELLTSLGKCPFPGRSTCSSPDGLYTPSWGRPSARSCLWTWCAAAQHQTTSEGWRPAGASASLCSVNQNPTTTRWDWVGR